jgi:hypothetical protein
MPTRGAKTILENERGVTMNWLSLRNNRLKSKTFKERIEIILGESMEFTSN